MSLPDRWEVLYNFRPIAPAGQMHGNRLREPRLEGLEREKPVAGEMRACDGRARRRRTALGGVLCQPLDFQSNLQPARQVPPRTAEKKAYPAITEAPCQEIGCARQAILADAVAPGVVHAALGRPTALPCLGERHFLSVSIVWLDS